MNLRNVLDIISEAQDAGDLKSASPVFAVIRNAAVPVKSPDAWHAVSIVDVVADSTEGVLGLITDDADDAHDITVATLRTRAEKLSADVREYPVLIRPGSGADGDVDHGTPVVEAYGDEHGLGLMAHFEGYEDWLLTQQ